MQLLLKNRLPDRDPFFPGATWQLHQHLTPNAPRMPLVFPLLTERGNAPPPPPFAALKPLAPSLFLALMAHSAPGMLLLPFHLLPMCMVQAGVQRGLRK